MHIINIVPEFCKAIIEVLLHAYVCEGKFYFNIDRTGLSRYGSISRITNPT